jgi:hypothetical protein
LSLAVLVLGVAFLGCRRRDTPPPALINQYDQTHDWAYGFRELPGRLQYSLHGGTSATFEVTDLTGNSIAQIALYAPGVRWAISIFTGTNNEYRCNHDNNCATMPAQVINDFPLSVGGVYRLAVTRDWGASCGGAGTYRLVIGADKRFEFPARTVNDVATLAPGAECPVVIR